MTVAAEQSPGFELSQRQKIFTLVGCMLGMFLAALDQNIVGTAAPAIQKSLHIEPALYTWITTAYMVSSTVLVPIYGKLSDLFGRRRIILTGIFIFLGASVLCGFAQTTSQLIAFRALQGVGSASLFTSAFAVIADLFPPAERGKYSGMFGAMFGISSLIGPLLGGFITDNFGWHWVFFINLPIGAVAIFFILTRMPPLQTVWKQKPAIDFLGAFTLVLGVVPLLLALSFGRGTLRAGDSGWLWGSWQILSLFAVALVGIVAFVLAEKSAQQPLIDLSLFKIPMFRWGNLTVFVIGCAFLAPMVFLPLFMVRVVGVSATASGLTLSPLVLGLVAGNVTSGQIVSRIGKYKPIMLFALLLLSAGFAIVGFTLTPDSTRSEVTLKMVLIGLGLGPSIPLYTLAIQNAVPPHQIGVATSATTFFRQMGSTIGIALVGTLFASTLAEQMGTHIPAALAGLPEQARAQMGRFAGGGAPSSAAPDAEGAPPQSAMFDPVAVKEQLGGKLKAGRDLAAKAIRGDTVAALAVGASPLANDQLKAAISDGGVKAQVKKKFEALRAEVDVNASSGDEAKWKQFVHRDGWSPELKEQLAHITWESLGTPENREVALAPLRQALTLAADAAGTAAENAAIAGVDAAINAAQTQLDSGIDKISRAIKESFTEAVKVVYRVSVVIALIAFLLTALLLPVLPLRRSNGPPAPVIAE